MTLRVKNNLALLIISFFVATALINAIVTKNMGEAAREECQYLSTQ